MATINTFYILKRDNEYINNPMTKPLRTDSLTSIILPAGQRPSTPVYRVNDLPKAYIKYLDTNKKVNPYTHLASILPTQVKAHGYIPSPLLTAIQQVVYDNIPKATAARENGISPITLAKHLHKLSQPPKVKPKAHSYTHLAGNFEQLTARLQISPATRSALYMVVVGGLSQYAAAKATGINPKTLRAGLQKISRTHCKCCGQSLT